MNEVFTKQKLSSQAKVDLSRKGAVDEPIVDLIAFINNSSAYFTTSSCSGRIYVFENGSDEDQRKKGCQWLYTTHSVCDYAEVEAALKKSTGNASIKFEPFVLHVQCCTMEDARMMHEVAVASGFRNSGITVGKRGKVVVAVRSTHTLEAPLTHNRSLLVDGQYIQFIVELACTKLKENFRRIDLFFERLKTALNDSKLSRSLHAEDLVDTDDLAVSMKHHRNTKASKNVKNSYNTNNVDNVKKYPKRTMNGLTDDDEQRTLNGSSLVHDEPTVNGSSSVDDERRTVHDEQRTANGSFSVDDGRRTVNDRTDDEFNCMDSCLLFGMDVD